MRRKQPDQVASEQRGQQSEQNHSRFQAFHLFSLLSVHIQKPTSTREAMVGNRPQRMPHILALGGKGTDKTRAEQVHLDPPQ
jgi:hypothetical protein